MEFQPFESLLIFIILHIFFAKTQTNTLCIKKHENRFFSLSSFNSDEKRLFICVLLSGKTEVLIEFNYQDEYKSIMSYATEIKQEAV